MCGIAGYIGARPQKELLLSMISQVEHRGPDGFGYYIDGQVGLAHARLSIIDIEGGAQPIMNEDGTIWITFNGEIYNYLELRKILESQGHTFKTDTDTEVIIHAYEEFGTDCISAFNGQFAFVIWDSNKEIAFLGRDRVGIQPLFYSVLWSKRQDNTADYDRTLYFGSEVKALLANRDLAKGLDNAEVANVLTYWAPRHGQSVFKDIRELPPGCCMTFNANGGESKWQYWDHNFDERENIFGLDYHLQNAVDFRLRADVPVGAYLSGGLDSTITATLARNRVGDNLHTFSIAFEDKQYDESEYQNALVKRLGTQHHTFNCTTEDIAGALPRVIHHAEKPMFRTAPIPMFLLSRSVREAGFKVVLTGEGADEVFAGYDIFRENFVREQMLRDDVEPAYINKLLVQLYPWMDERMLTSSTDYLKVFFGGSKEDANLVMFSHLPRIKAATKVHAFLLDDAYPSTAGSYFGDFRPMPRKGLARAQYIEWNTLFNGYLMSTQGDRMLMANGIEGRFPFLDPNVVDYGNSLPDNEKMRVLEDGITMQEKSILTKYAIDHDWAPNFIFNRKKQPYMAPDAECFLRGDDTPDYVNFLLSPDANFGIFNMKKVGILRKKLEAGKGRGFAENMAFMGILSTQALNWQMGLQYTTLPTVEESRFKVRVEKLG